MRRLLLSLVASLALGAPASAQPQPPLPLVIEGDKPIGLGVVDGGLTAVVKVDGQGVWRLTEVRKGGPSSVEPEPDQITFTLEAAPASTPGLWLRVANGYAQTLTYEAAIRKDGKISRTSVCPVSGGLSGVEAWPFTFDALLMRRLSLGPAPSGLKCD